MPALLKLTGLVVGLLVALSPAQAAAAPLRYCRSVAAALKADADLAAAARAAFGQPEATDDETCLYPLQLLRYADVDVLVSQVGEPGQACHGCEAELSATVLKRVPAGLRRLTVYAAFAKLGSNGAAGAITPIAIGGDDAIAIESGGTFQGYTASALDLYAFRRRGLVHLDPGANLADRRRRQRRRDRRQQGDRRRLGVVAGRRRADDRLPRRRRARQTRQPRRVERRRGDADPEIRRAAEGTRQGGRPGVKEGGRKGARIERFHRLGPATPSRL